MSKKPMPLWYHLLCEWIENKKWGGEKGVTLNYLVGATRGDEPFANEDEAQEFTQSIYDDLTRCQGEGIVRYSFCGTKVSDGVVTVKNVYADKWPAFGVLWDEIKPHVMAGAYSQTGNSFGPFDEKKGDMEIIEAARARMAKDSD